MEQDISSDSDKQWMRRALRLAVRARHASPNPSVGCVLVNAKGAKVGEGYTQPPGGPHAEVVALQQAGEASRGATAYVTLEPCSHWGRTPPCADALIRAGVARVVAAVADPDARVGGRGLARLAEAGIGVVVGVGEERARALNAPFFKHRLTGLPWVTLKTAMTLDGKIATRTGQSQWITSPLSRLAVHRTLRDRCDALLTGVGTILADDPSLTTRLVRKQGRNPWRIVVDSRARTPLGAQVVRQSQRDGRTILAVTPAAAPEQRRALEEAGCRVLVCRPDAVGRVDLADLLARVGTQGDIIGVLMEGGAELAASALGAGLVDRWLAFIAPKVVGGATAPGPVGGVGVAVMDEALSVRVRRITRCGPDIRIDTQFG